MDNTKLNDLLIKSMVKDIEDEYKRKKKVNDFSDRWKVILGKVFNIYLNELEELDLPTNNHSVLLEHYSNEDDNENDLRFMHIGMIDKKFY